MDHKGSLSQCSAVSHQFVWFCLLLYYILEWTLSIMTVCTFVSQTDLFIMQPSLEGWIKCCILSLSPSILYWKFTQNQWGVEISNLVDRYLSFFENRFFVNSWKTAEHHFSIFDNDLFKICSTSATNHTCSVCPHFVDGGLVEIHVQLFFAKGICVIGIQISLK